MEHPYQKHIETVTNALKKRIAPAHIARPISLSIFVVLLVALSWTSETRLILREHILQNSVAPKPPLERVVQTYPSLTARSFISLALLPNGQTMRLATRSATVRWPIASITKLMTALVATDTYNPDDIITVSPQAIAQEEISGRLVAGQTFSVHNMLYPLLLESSNDAAYALAEKNGVDKFISTMNSTAQSVGMSRTHFINPHGLDDFTRTDKQFNESTADDIAHLVLYLEKNHPDILEITRTQNALLAPQSQPNRSVQAYTLRNTNKLLTDPSVMGDIIGGKTGQTDLAKQTLTVLTIAPDGKTLIAHVVLQSDDRFGDMKALVNWTKTAYNWKQ